MMATMKCKDYAVVFVNFDNKYFHKITVKKRFDLRTSVEGTCAGKYRRNSHNGAFKKYRSVFMIQPLRNELLIKPFSPKEMIGSMVVPDSAKQRPSKALVLAVGRGTKQNPMILKEGDVVFHVLGAGDEYELENEKVWMVRSTDCLAYIPNAVQDEQKKILNKWVEERKNSFKLD